MVVSGTGEVGCRARMVRRWCVVSVKVTLSGEGIVGLVDFDR